MAKTLIVPILLLVACTVARAAQDRNEADARAQREKFLSEFRNLSDNGHLAAAEALLEEAQRAGLDQTSYQKCFSELEERRGQAMHHIETGDGLLRTEHYKEARSHYQQARRIDRDNTLVAGKLEMVERFEREARARVVRETVNIAVPMATKVLSEYFEFKREEEQRKREEAERAKRHP
jgi:tetratricopeptide (TPR) repeat protein